MMRRRLPLAYAPEATCPTCGWSGHDWAFKYQRHCSKCYRRWRKEQAERRRKLRPPNENVEIAPGLIVTTKVKERLRRLAEAEIPHSRQWHVLRVLERLAVPILFVTLVLMGVFNVSLPDHMYGWLWIGLLVLATIGTLAMLHTMEILECKRAPTVAARLEELARERQASIEAAAAFYASSEWVLLRKQVIEQEGRVCQECGCRIVDDHDLTVDHVLPRSKFPALALERSNLQVLCRSCNAIKATHLPNGWSEE